MTAIVTTPAAAGEGCVTLAPGVDGVLRLDHPRAPGWPCAGPIRVYAALPPHPSAPAPRPARASASPPRPSPDASRLSPSPLPSTAEDLIRLTRETARLEADLARLNAETADLRAETRRLRDQLARRDAGEIEGDGPRSGVALQGRVAPASPDAATPRAGRPDQPAAAPPPVRTGEERARDLTAAAPPSSAPEARISADQVELARRKSVVVRALGELRDLAARMRKDLSGAPP